MKETRAQSPDFSPGRFKRWLILFLLILAVPAWAGVTVPSRNPILQSARYDTTGTTKATVRAWGGDTLQVFFVADSTGCAQLFWHQDTLCYTPCDANDTIRIGRSAGALDDTTAKYLSTDFASGEWVAYNATTNQFLPYAAGVVDVGAGTVNFDWGYFARLQVDDSVLTPHIKAITGPFVTIYGYIRDTAVIFGVDTIQLSDTCWFVVNRVDGQLQRIWLTRDSLVGWMVVDTGSVGGFGSFMGDKAIFRGGANITLTVKDGGANQPDTMIFTGADPGGAADNDTTEVMVPNDPSSKTRKLLWQGSLSQIILQTDSGAVRIFSDSALGISGTGTTAIGDTLPIAGNGVLALTGDTIFWRYWGSGTPWVPWIVSANPSHGQGYIYDTVGVDGFKLSSGAGSDNDSTEAVVPNDPSNKTKVLKWHLNLSQIELVTDSSAVRIHSVKRLGIRSDSVLAFGDTVYASGMGSLALVADTIWIHWAGTDTGYVAIPLGTFPSYGKILKVDTTASGWPVIRWQNDSTGSGTGGSDSIGYDLDGGAMDGFLFPSYLREGSNVTFTVSGDTLTIAGAAAGGTGDTLIVNMGGTEIGRAHV